MSGRRQISGGERALLSPRRVGDGGGDDDDDHRRHSMPGCLGLFARWKKRQAATTGRVAAAPPAPAPAPAPPAPAHDVKELTAADSKEDVEQLSAPDIRELPAEIDTLIVSKIPLIFDRSALQGVCGRWRSATLTCTTAPLPLIINADHTLTNYFAEGADSVTQKMNPLIDHPGTLPSTCLGSLGNWVVAGYEHHFDPQANLDLIHHECYLLQPIKGGMVRLPSPASFHCRGGLSGSLEVLSGNGRFSYAQPAKECRLRLQKVAVSRTRGLMNFKVAALATQRGDNHIIFCTPESSSWTIASADFITIGSDLEFFDESLFVLGSNQDELFMINFGPHLCMFPTVSLVQRCAAIQLPVDENTQQQRNLVRSDKSLLLVVRYFNVTWDQLTGVRVFELNANSFTWSEKRSIGSMSILISLSCSECIDTYAHKEIRSDHIYFLDHFCPNFLPADDQRFSYRSQMYSIRTGTVTEHLIGSEPAKRRPGYPMWFFPSD